MNYLIAGALGAQIAIDITVLWYAFKLGQHEARLDKLQEKEEPPEPTHAD